MNKNFARQFISQFYSYLSLLKIFRLKKEVSFFFREEKFLFNLQLLENFNSKMLFESSIYINWNLDYFKICFSMPNIIEWV